MGGLEWVGQRGRRRSRPGALAPPPTTHRPLPTRQPAPPPATTCRPPPAARRPAPTPPPPHPFAFLTTISQVWYASHSGSLAFVLPFLNVYLVAGGLTPAQIGLLAALRPIFGTPAGQWKWVEGWWGVGLGRVGGEGRAEEGTAGWDAAHGP